MSDPRVLRVMVPIEGTELEFGDFVVLFDGKGPRLVRYIDVDYGRLMAALDAGKLVALKRDADVSGALQRLAASGAPLPSLQTPPDPPPAPLPPSSRRHLRLE